MFLNPLKPTLIANMFESRARIVCLFFYKQFSRGLKRLRNPLGQLGQLDYPRLSGGCPLGKALSEQDYNPRPEHKLEFTQLFMQIRVLLSTIVHGTFLNSVRFFSKHCSPSCNFYLPK